jgi:hypothetical protein
MSSGEYVGIAFVLAGAAVIAWSLWKISTAVPDGPAEQIGPYVYPFVVGAAIAILGGFVLLGYLIVRLLT